MTAMLMRFTAALIVTYFGSRVTLRLAMPGRGLARLAAAHGVSAFVLGGFFVWLRDSNDAALWILAAQAGWFALDGARGLASRPGVTGRAA